MAVKVLSSYDHTQQVMKSYTYSRRIISISPLVVCVYKSVYYLTNRFTLCFTARSLLLRYSRYFIEMEHIAQKRRTQFDYSVIVSGARLNVIDTAMDMHDWRQWCQYKIQTSASTFFSSIIGHSTLTLCKRGSNEVPLYKYNFSGSRVSSSKRL